MVVAPGEEADENEPAAGEEDGGVCLDCGERVDCCVVCAWERVRCVAC